MTTKQTFTEHLSTCDVKTLQEILNNSKISYASSATSVELAEQISINIWKHSHTPVGQMIREHSFEDITTLYANKLQINLSTKNGWSQLQELVENLVPLNAPVAFEELPVDLQERLKTSQKWSNTAGFTGIGTAITSGALSKWLLKATSGKLFDLIKFLPTIGPAIIAIRSALGWVAVLSGPVGIAIGLWVLNNNLGPKLDKGLQLLLGVGLALRPQQAQNG